MTELAKTHDDHLLPADPMVSMIERVAMDPSASIEKLERMMELKQRLDAQTAKSEFAAAFAKASASFPTIPFNGKSNNGKYATLKDIIGYTRPILSENGLALTFAINTGEAKIVVTAKLMHKSGHSEETSIALPADTSGSKNAVQSIGSSQKYGQRYTAQAILGLSLGDDTEDDGKSAMPQERYPSWAQTVIQDLPPTATARDKAVAIADALVSQFGRMKGERQLMNEWDRRAELTANLEEKHPDLHGRVVDAYEVRMNDIKEEKDRP